MPTRTKNIEMKYIINNLEVYLHYSLCEFSGFKTGRSSNQKCSIKKVFLKISQTDRKNLCWSLFSYAGPSRPKQACIRK